MSDIDKLDQVITALKDYFPYDIRVKNFRVSINRLKKQLDNLHGNVWKFMKQEGIKDDIE